MSEKTAEEMQKEIVASAASQASEQVSAKISPEMVEIKSAINALT